MQDLTPQDRFRLITFNIRVNRLVDFGTPRSAVDAALRGVRTFGPSAMRDAMAIALTTAADPGRRPLLLVIAEADDRSSVTNQDSLLEVARRAATRIALVMPASSPAVATQREQLYGALAKTPASSNSPIGQADGGGSEVTDFVLECRPLRSNRGTRRSLSWNCVALRLSDRCFSRCATR